jgi:uncharacterized OB-fold protein
MLERRRAAEGRLSGVPVSVCSACGHAVFPARVLCSRCGGSEWETHEADEGIVEDLTVVRRAPGGELAVAVPLGTVRVEGGALVLARLEAGVGAGTSVALEYRDGIPVARNQHTP